MGVLPDRCLQECNLPKAIAFSICVLCVKINIPANPVGWVISQCSIKKHNLAKATDFNICVLCAKIDIPANPVG